jgi:tRNA modification GTPase
LSLVVVDASAPLAPADRAWVADSPGLVVISKVDLPRAWAASDLDARDTAAVEVSALSGAGLADLRREIAARLTAREDLRDPPVISNIRHLSLVGDTRAAVGRAESALASAATEEIVLVDLNQARRALEEITGRRTPDDLLRHIFSRFCIGK